MKLGQKQQQFIEECFRRLNHCDGLELIEGVAKTERTEFARLFRHLAVKGRLPEADGDHLLAVFNQQVSWETIVTLRAGRADFSTKMNYRSDYARVVHVLLELSRSEGSPVRVGLCKKCDGLFLAQQRGRGRPSLLYS